MASTSAARRVRAVTIEKRTKMNEKNNNKQKPVRLEKGDCIGKSSDYIQRQESFRVNIFLILSPNFTLLVEAMSCLAFDRHF